LGQGASQLERDLILTDVFDSPQFVLKSTWPISIIMVTAAFNYSLTDDLF